jgi:hypothetical protein
VALAGTVGGGRVVRPQCRTKDAVTDLTDGEVAFTGNVEESLADLGFNLIHNGVKTHARGEQSADDGIQQFDTDALFVRQDETFPDGLLVGSIIGHIPDDGHDPSAVAKGYGTETDLDRELRASARRADRSRSSPMGRGRGEAS